MDDGTVAYTTTYRDIDPVKYTSISSSQIFFIILILILVLVIIGLFYILATQNINKINPRDCSTARTNWGVIPGADGNTLFACGPNGTSACTLNNVPSIAEAILECDRRSEICTMFSYNTNTKVFAIVGNATTDGQGSNSVFIRQQDPIRTPSPSSTSSS